MRIAINYYVIKHLMYDYWLMICFLLTINVWISFGKQIFVSNFSIRPPMLVRGRITYKTTYACEGNPLHLLCSEGTTIHLVRANYGRFSISFCNDGGRLDLSVNCMSYRSFLIMQDRCSQKSNCSVLVSSKIFGDPCPGTPKYLEVQYHCIDGRASSATTTRRPHITIIPSSNNNSLLYPSVQPPISYNEDVTPFFIPEAQSPNVKYESSQSYSISPSRTTSTTTTWTTRRAASLSPSVSPSLSTTTASSSSISHFSHCMKRSRKLIEFKQVIFGQNVGEDRLTRKDLNTTKSAMQSESAAQSTKVWNAYIILAVILIDIIANNVFYE